MNNSTPPQVVSVNRSATKGTAKHSVPEIVIDERGVKDDAHWGQGYREVSLLALASCERFAQETGRRVGAGQFGENITMTGVSPDAVQPLDVLVCGAVRLLVTQIGKQCHDQKCAIRREVGRCVMPKEGIFGRVLRGGTVKPGDAIVHEPKIIRGLIITLSDRASHGAYEDRSGPELESLFQAYWQSCRRRVETRRCLIPDDAGTLRRELESAREQGIDVVLTTGGTGIGPRDMTPEVVAAFCDRCVPGVMEQIRLKYGTEHPQALLSRSVMGVKGTLLVYALPGSVRAVREYMQEITKTMAHAIDMVHGLDTH